MCSTLIHKHRNTHTQQICNTQAWTTCCTCTPPNHHWFASDDKAEWPRKQNTYSGFLAWNLLCSFVETGMKFWKDLYVILCHYCVSWMSGRLCLTSFLVLNNTNIEHSVALLTFSLVLPTLQWDSIMTLCKSYQALLPIFIYMTKSVTKSLGSRRRKV